MRARARITELVDDIKNCLIESDDFNNSDQIEVAISTAFLILEIIDEIESLNNESITSRDKIKDMVW